MHDFDYVVLARLFVAQDKPEEAQRLLQRLYEAAAARGRTAKLVEVLILQALAWQAEKNTAQAMAALEQALRLAEPGGFVRTFVDEGPPLARLLYEALSRGIAPDYTRRLLAAFPVSESAQPIAPTTPTPDGELVEPLSEREREVLHLVAEGLTNRAIADRLYLSPHTIKVHTRNIYGKLGVNNRTQAVARGRDLGILPLA